MIHVCILVQTILMNVIVRTTIIDTTLHAPVSDRLLQWRESCSSGVRLGKFSS